MRIFVDADGCPVKSEVLRVAKRCDLSVRLVANGGVDAPTDPRVERIVVGAGADVADDWIVEHVEPGDVVVTTDVPLAARCVKKGAAVLHPTGREFTEDDIGSALAMRDLLTRLRSEGERTRGPAPFADRDRSQFLQTLDTVVQRGLRRERNATRPA
jgi:uncharacterized protein YaiI (UPF0178 family)